MKTGLKDVKACSCCSASIMDHTVTQREFVTGSTPDGWTPQRGQATCPELLSYKVLKVGLGLTGELKP